MKFQSPSVPSAPLSARARFGVSPEDISKIDKWFESYGFQVRNMLNNAGIIDLAVTAGAA